MWYFHRFTLIGLSLSVLILQSVKCGVISSKNEIVDTTVFKDVSEEMPFFTNLEGVLGSGRDSGNRTGDFHPREFPELTKRAYFLSPSEDPFYKPPTGYEKYPPGTILHYRLVSRSDPPAFYFLTYNLEANYQLLYRTTDTYGNPTYTVLSIFIPYNPDYSKVVSYQMAEDAVNINCSPSYTIQINAPQSTQEHAEFLLVQALLNRNWIVIIPDYEGPLSSFACGVLEGQAILDGVRAALLSKSFTGIDPQAEVIPWGYSGAALATAWAAQLQQTYAPELSIIGWVVGGVPSNFTELNIFLNGGLWAGYLAAGLLGLATQYPSAQQFVETKITPEGLAQINTLYKACANELPFLSFTQITSDGEGVFSDPLLTSVFNKILLGSEPPKQPVFMYASQIDDIVPVNMVDELYDSWCEGGTVVTYRKDLSPSHILEFATGSPGAIQWIIDMFNGASMPSQCNEKTRLISALTWTNMAIVGKDIFYGFSNLFLRVPVGEVL